jgi:hypothetical protein
MKHESLLNSKTYLYFITYFSWHQCDKTHVIFFINTLCISTPRRPKRQVQGDKYAIKRISNVLWCNMIFIQRVVCFLSPSLDIQLVGLKSYHVTKHARYYTCTIMYITGWSKVIIDLYLRLCKSLFYSKTATYRRRDSEWY